MDYQTTFFAAMALVFFLLWVIDRMRTASIIERSTLEHRIALQYIAARKISCADYFARSFLDGDHASLIRWYRDFPSFRADAIRREQEFGE